MGTLSGGAGGTGCYWGVGGMHSNKTSILTPPFNPKRERRAKENTIEFEDKRCHKELFMSGWLSRSKMMIF